LKSVNAVVAVRGGNTVGDAALGGLNTGISVGAGRGVGDTAPGADVDAVLLVWLARELATIPPSATMPENTLELAAQLATLLLKAIIP
jgi:hypothetical protein